MGDSAGRPYAITLAEDGSRLLFLRGAGELWALEVDSGEQRRIATGVSQYAPDPACRSAAYVTDGQLHAVDLDSLAITPLPTPGPAVDPRPDPSGRRVAYVCQGALRVIDRDGRDLLLAGEADMPNVAWGGVDPATAAAFGRRRGYWWAPDGERVLAARTQTGVDRTVSLHLLDLDGSWVDVRWDRLTYPYLASVSWDRPGGPLATVLPRNQRHALVLAVDVRTGETQVHAELDDPRWVTLTPGTPAYLPDGRVVLGGELSLDAVDTRCLFADGSLLTPPWLYVRRLCGCMILPAPAGEGPEQSGQPAHRVDLIVEGSEGEPSEQHVYRLRLPHRSGSPEVTRLTPQAGWHRADAVSGAMVISSESLEHPGVQITLQRGPVRRVLPSGEPPQDAAEPPRPVLLRVTDRRLPVGVLYPADHVAGRRLPVLVEAGSPTTQGVTAARDPWRERQRIADHGYAVVVIDARGTPGVSPSFEKVIHRRVWDLTLADQADALAATAAKHPDLDLDRVAIRGAGFAGSIAVAAVLRYPESYAAAVAESPDLDWSRLNPAYAERYLGSPEENPEAYARHNLIAEAGELTRPLLLLGAAPELDEFAAAARFAGAAGRLERRNVAEPSSEDALEHLMGFIARSLEGA